MARLLPIFKAYDYKVNTRPYELNICGERSASTVANKFDDKIHVFYKDDKGTWQKHSYTATTDPGTYWLKNPGRVDGTAILAPGQYIDSHAIGLHRGQYKALVQINPVKVLRDYDRNAYLDFYNGTPQNGRYGINIHRSSATGTSVNVDRWSAGCQVFANGKDYAEFMQLCERHRGLYGNRFTYTLIDHRALQKQTLLKVGAAAGSLVIGAWLLWLGNSITLKF